ncbi:uncharacterized protein LOC131330868 [Rhododendron vialii]|uniref:uncharacterized protein LOC131330868 n=1 Tax=Rhododendron vialii TaxID=182163 RepID=UPI00265EEBEE|nr:uncharacterized protein LOC131330868 [Rhododendron vialii]
MSWGVANHVNRGVTMTEHYLYMMLFIIAILLFLSGAGLHGHHRSKIMYFGTHSCYFVERGVFSNAAVFSLHSVLIPIWLAFKWDTHKSHHRNTLSHNSLLRT